MHRFRFVVPSFVWLLWAAVLIGGGCKSIQKPPSGPMIPLPHMPHELAKTTLPPYIIEPPDILTIDAIRIVPRPPYRVNSLDVLSVQVAGTLPDAPIGGMYAVEPGGAINLGVPYGVVKVTGLTLEEVHQQIGKHLTRFLREPQVSVTLAGLSGKQNIAGQHLVSSDGTVTLGSYGNVFVTGMTLGQAKMAIESHLSMFLENPEISIDVFAYNSKVYYVVTQGADWDGITPFPITGNETVLDALANINGLPSVSSSKIWVARPTHGGQPQILPVDYNGITAGALADTNYQLLPGDRVFVAQDKLIYIDTVLGKVISPIERIFGFTTLGTQTVRGIKFFNQQGGGGGVGGGF